jgi:hypothetical protein
MSNPCYHILCVIDPSSSTESAIVLRSWFMDLLLHFLGLRSYVLDASFVLPPFPHEPAWALRQTSPQL